MSTPRLPARARFHHGDLHRALIEAARGLLEREGVEGLSLRKLAQAAGVSHAAPYHHFKDRSALLAALAEEDFHALAACTAAAADSAGPDPFDRLAASGAAYIGFAIAHPASFALMFRPELTQPETNPCVDSAGDTAFAQLTRTVADCLGPQAAPERQQDVVLSAWACVHGAAALWLDGPLSRHKSEQPLQPEAMATRITRSFSEMLREQVRAEARESPTRDP
ncbi:TetR/AcrR family transcriptional regulator [Aquimonas sp.]|uniref:TetR/AcrR family transcriptional regulator n=1 Tax=Aquimonas sp. TaxID=1872588 RepID=UPI0037C16EBB